MVFVGKGRPNSKGEIGNRGSKSVPGLYKPMFKSGTVKEQRVDGGW